MPAAKGSAQFVIGWSVSRKSELINPAQCSCRGANPSMKSLLTAALLFAAGLNTVALAYSPNDTRPLTPAPRVVPSSVVRPTGLPYHFAGAVINVEFSLDRNGRPQNVKVLWVDDPRVKRQLAAAFRQWRFEPGTKEAVEAGKRFILPVEIRPEA
jgi:hypothetical protein